MSELFRGFTPDIEIRSAAKGGDGRTVEGIVVPYNRDQPIPYEGIVERFVRGAFNHQLGAFHRVKFTREHMSMGGVLIGRGVEARDDAAGLWAALRVSATPAGDETLELIRDGALDEFSIGFRQLKPSWSKVVNGVTERRRADMFEVSSVIRGAYGQAAKVKAVRSAEGQADEDELDDVAEPVIPAQAGTPNLERLRAIRAGLPPLLTVR